MKTELMEQILKSPSAQTIINWMSPIYGEAYTMLWLIQIIGRQLDKEEDWIEDFHSEIVPQTATWSIGIWEKQYEITPESWWTLEQRRQNIVNRAAAYLPMNPERLNELMSTAINAAAYVTENTGKNKFDVTIAGSPYMRDAAIKVIDKNKPAHLIYDLYVKNSYKASQAIHIYATASKRKHHVITSWGQKHYHVGMNTSIGIGASRHKHYITEV